MRFTATFVDNEGSSREVASLDTGPMQDEAAYRLLMIRLHQTFSAGEFPRAEREVRLLLNSPYAQLLAWAAYQEGRKDD